MKRSQKTLKRIVVKVGSSILTGGKTTIVSENLSRIVRLIALFTRDGKEVVLVTSGAVASGLSVLGLSSRPAAQTQLSVIQAAASTGQNILMQAYSRESEKAGLGLKYGQVLLTRDDFNDEKRYNNARNTIDTLLKYKIVPVINENDAISVDEIKFGDNDTLSALVAGAVDADGLLILTDTEGLYDHFDAKTKTRGKLIKVVKEITPEIEYAACGTDKASCVGGMSTKIEAARIATNMGIPVILASGFKDDLNIDFVSAEGDGTLFAVSENHRLSLKKRWIAFGASGKGRIYVDEGAREALVLGFKSLLAPGIISVDGHFKAGDIVEIVEQSGKSFAKGKVEFTSAELTEVKGKKNKMEVIHRDNLVILG